MGDKRNIKKMKERNNLQYNDQTNQIDPLIKLNQHMKSKNNKYDDYNGYQYYDDDKCYCRI